MKKISLITLGIAALLMCGPMFAQNTVQAKVPFGFYVGNSKLLPAGTYRIAPCATNVIAVRHCTEGIAVMHLVMPSGKSPVEKGRLVFHKYGDKYFLSELQGPNVSSGMVLPLSSNEKSIQEEFATVSTYETITLPKPAEPDKP